MKIRRAEEKTRQAGPSPHPDDGFDIYDSTDAVASTEKMGTGSCEKIPRELK